MNRALNSVNVSTFCQQMNTCLHFLDSHVNSGDRLMMSLFFIHFLFRLSRNTDLFSHHECMHFYLKSRIAAVTRVMFDMLHPRFYPIYVCFGPISPQGSFESNLNVCHLLCESMRLFLGVVISAEAEARPYRGALHDVPPDWFVPAALAEVQQVVHHYLADQVVSGEAVEVVHGEMQLPGM